MSRCRLVAIVLALAVAAALPAPPARAQVTDAGAIVYPPLPEVEIPEPRRVVLDNGMVVMLLEDRELPLVDVLALVRTGERWEPASKVGLAGLVGATLRSGGIEGMPSDELDDLLEDRAAIIETSIGTTSGSATLSCLRDDLPEMLRIFAGVLRRPAFEEQKLAVAKNLALATIARQNDDPGQIAAREFQKLIYGPDSPYARTPTYATVGNVSRDDLVAWHRTYFHPDRVILGLAGDFDAAAALELVREVFGDWQRGPEIDPPEAGYRREPAPGVFYVEKDGVTQSTIRIGHLGIRRDSPDYYAVTLLNQVLGGSFASRLFAEVRSARGLAYSVWGAVGSQWDYPGLFQMVMSTKTETTVAGIEALLAEARRLLAEPPTEEEVESARAGILNSFVFRADSTREILNRQMTYEYYGEPLDRLERFRRGIETTGVEAVRAAAAKYIHPERFSILVVGLRDGLDRPLATLGEVREIDVTIPVPDAPAPGAPAPAASEEDRLRTEALLARAVEGIGGAERLDRLETLRLTASMATVDESLAFEARALVALPDRLRREAVLPFGSVIQVLDGERSFLRSPSGVQPLPETLRRELEESVLRLVPVILKRRGEAGFEAAYAGSAEVGGTAVERVRVALDGVETVLGIDPETGRVLTLAYRGRNLSNVPGEIVETLSDFRAVDGLRLPFASTVTWNGEPMLRGTVVSAELDAEVADAEFAPPPG